MKVRSLNEDKMTVALLVTSEPGGNVADSITPVTLTRARSDYLHGYTDMS